jgi:hypothetical protein
MMNWFMKMMWGWKRGLYLYPARVDMVVGGAGDWNVNILPVNFGWVEECEIFVT